MSPNDGRVVRRLVPATRMPAVVLAACVAAIACVKATSSRANQGPAREASAADSVDSVPRRPAAVDLTGAWLAGSAGEPAVDHIVVHRECNYSPATWVIEQRGDTVRAWTIPASRAQGVRSPAPVASVPAEGRLSGVDLTMGTASARYVLRYDSTSGHLRGTLNGAPFWAVRQVIVQPERCIPVP